jgi:hypothetical protein
MYSPNFKPFEFERFKNEAGRDYFSLTPKKWVAGTNAIGTMTKSGRYGGGTFAHSDIAFKFAAWISPEFELYLATEFKRLRQAERLTQLDTTAIVQLRSLLEHSLTQNLYKFRKLKA